MARCEQCQTCNRPERRFCAGCGAPLVISCPACGFSNEPEARYCGGCGIALDVCATAHNRVVEAAAETGVQSGAATGGERRQLTVMLCDLVGSTAMSTRLDPEELSEINRGYQQTASEIIARHGGYVARYMGDGILAYFGYPAAHEDDAERAIYAGLELLERITQSGEAGIEIAIRVGLATGPTVVGELIGNGSSREHAAVGVTPNLAARVQSAAPPGVLVITGLTRRLAGELFVYESLGEQSLKGFDEPIPLWRVIGEAATTSRFEASGRGRFPALVGRQRETALLDDLWRQAAAGDGQAALLSGEAGNGMSRLVQYASELAEASESIVARFQCSPHHQSHALYAVTQYLRSAAAIAEGDEPGTALDKLSVFFRQAGLDAENTTPLLAGLLGIDTSPATTASPADARQRKQTLMALVELLRGFAEVRPLLLVVEDLHWGDPTTVELLDRIVHQTPTLPLLIVASYRSGFESPWLDSPHVHLLHLNRMDAGQSRSLAQQVAGKPLPEAVLEQIVDKTDGVPLFVEELTRTVLNGGWLLEEQDGYRLAEKNPAFTIPETLRDSLMARLDSLGDARLCAQAAAVIGREFEPGLLAAISGDTPQSLDDSLQQLIDSGLVYPTVSGLRQTYMFKHALIQDTAYESLLKSQRQAMHQRLACFLEAERPEYAARQPDLLAHHYQHAGEYLQAAQYWQQAGKQAIRQSAQQEAINHLETGLEALYRTPPSPQRDQLELATRLDLAACYRLTDRYDDALDCLSAAEQLATGLDRIEDLSGIHYLRGNIYFPTGNLEGCLEQHNLSLDFARKDHSPEKEARAIGGLGDAYYLRRQMRSAAKQFTRCCSIAEQHGFLSLDSANRSMIGWSRLHLFEFNEALEDASRATAVARECKNPRGEMMARALACFSLGLLGETERAREEGRAARQLAIKVGTSNFEAAVLYFQSEAADGEEKRTLLEDAMDKSRAGGITFHGPAILGALALITADNGKRKTLWAEAEAVLAAGCVGHNYFWFYRHAIDGALDYEDWEAALRFGYALEESVAREPVAWSRFYAEYTRALVAAGRSEQGEAIERRLRALYEQATAAGLVSAAQRAAKSLSNQKPHFSTKHQ